MPLEGFSTWNEAQEYQKFIKHCMGQKRVNNDKVRAFPKYNGSSF